MDNNIQTTLAKAQFSYIQEKQAEAREARKQLKSLSTDLASNHLNQSFWTFFSAIASASLGLAAIPCDPKGVVSQNLMIGAQVVCPKFLEGYSQIKDGQKGKIQTKQQLWNNLLSNLEQERSSLERWTEQYNSHFDEIRRSYRDRTITILA